MTPRSRFQAALERNHIAFAPLLWKRLPSLVHQERADWWQDPTTGQRLIADAAALALADAMFVFVAAEAVSSAASQGSSGDAALDSLAETQAAVRGIELVQCLSDVAQHATIAAVPAPAQLLSDLGGEEIESAEDAFSDLASAYLQCGADALAVTGSRSEDVRAGVTRAVALGKLYDRPVLGIWLDDDDDAAEGWDQDGVSLGVISSGGEWPVGASGLVITPGDVSGRWGADQLRAVGSSRP
jgi:hypothetical protein